MKETLEKEPMLLNYDEQKHNLVYRIVGKFAAEVNEFASEYNDFAQEIGLEDKFGPEILQKIFDSGRQWIELKIEAIVKTKDKPLTKFYLEAYYKQLNDLDLVLRDIRPGIKAYEVPNELKKVSSLPWKGGKVIVDDRYFESIKPYFETWARTEQEHEVWNRYKAIEEAYNEFFNYCNQEGILVKDGFNGLFGHSFERKRHSVTADPKFIFPLHSADYFEKPMKI